VSSLAAAAASELHVGKAGLVCGMDLVDWLLVNLPLTLRAQARRIGAELLSLHYIETVFYSPPQDGGSADEVIPVNGQFFADDAMALYALVVELPPKTEVLVADDPDAASIAPGASLADYQFKREISRGGFGIVYEAVHRTSLARVAIKQLDKGRFESKDDLTSLRRERDVGLSDCLFLVLLHSIFQTERYLYMVLEYAPGGDLRGQLDRLYSLPEMAVRFIGAEVLLGLEYLHSKGIVHRDLKPANLLFDGEGHVKVADYGFAGFAHESGGSITVDIGTVGYVAPEVSSGSAGDLQMQQVYDGRCDVWTLGVILFECLTGTNPFAVRTWEDYDVVLQPTSKLPLDRAKMSPLAKDALEQFTRWSWKARPTTDACLNHPWFTTSLSIADLRVRRVQSPFYCQAPDDEEADPIGTTELHPEAAPAKKSRKKRGGASDFALAHKRTIDALVSDTGSVPSMLVLSEAFLSGASAGSSVSKSTAGSRASEATTPTPPEVNEPEQAPAKVTKKKSGRKSGRVGSKGSEKEKKGTRKGKSAGSTAASSGASAAGSHLLNVSPSPSGHRGAAATGANRLPNPLAPFLAATASNLRLQFSTGTPLGVGGGGAVFRCVHKATGMRVALKEIRVTQFRPAELISDVDHPNVVRVLGSFRDEQCNQCIVQEFCALGDVSKPLADGHASKYPTKLVTYIAASVAEALAFIHSLNHVHRDIKPENIFVTEAGQVKLGDFGVSKRLAESDRYTDTMAGTPHYLGPEVLRQGGVTLVSDVWALGISIIELATGKLPHAELKPFHVITKVAEDEPPVLSCDSPDLVKVTAAMLKREPAERIGCADLVRSSYLCGKSKDAKQARKLVRFLTKGTRKKRAKDQGEDAGWSFESECTAAKAEVLLEGDEPGSFLVRPAFSAENAVSVSFVASDRSVQHAHVHVDPAGRGFFLDDSVPVPQRVYYATMEEVAQVTGLGGAASGSHLVAPKPRPGSTYQPLPVAQFPVDETNFVSTSVTSREVAEHRLTHNGRQPGAWLLRPTSAGGPETVCLSGLDHGGNVYHSLIDRTPTGFTIQSDDLSGEVFATVPILLQALASKSLIDANAYCGD